jgi:hypothetical protein
MLRYGTVFLNGKFSYISTLFALVAGISALVGGI